MSARARPSTVRSSIEPCRITATSRPDGSGTAALTRARWLRARPVRGRAPRCARRRACRSGAARAAPPRRARRVLGEHTDEAPERHARTSPQRHVGEEHQHRRAPRDPPATSSAVAQQHAGDRHDPDGVVDPRDRRDKDARERDERYGGELVTGEVRFACAPQTDHEHGHRERGPHGRGRPADPLQQTVQRLVEHVAGVARPFRMDRDLEPIGARRAGAEQRRHAQSPTVVADAIATERQRFVTAQ